MVFKKRYHTTTVSSPPMRQTKEQTDQTKDTTENKKRTENQSHAQRIIGKFLMPVPA